MDKNETKGLNFKSTGKTESITGNVCLKAAGPERERGRFPERCAG